MPGSSQTRGLSFSGTRSISPGASSVRSSQDTFPLEDMNNAVSNDSMPAVAVNIA